MPQESAARRYRIEKYLTEGGMGAIYIGKKLGPGGFAKEVVLKQLLPEYTSRPEFRDLFFREAKISATLDHANIVHTFDLVESDQSLFIVMEYVRGADLRTIIRRARYRKRQLSPAAAIHIALEILAGLGYAHARRDATGKSLDIIHRDVSPSNIICSVQGAAKLSDFGIAKASTYSSVFYRVRGKVGYMSPEQARNQPIDHRCDLYSLAVCLYESLSGERLFVGDLNTPADEIYGIAILPPSHKRNGLPKALDNVLGRALAANVDDRYQSAADLADALRTVAHRTGLSFSAPELAAHLRDILGSDPDRWLHDDPAMPVEVDAPPPAPTSNLVGTEAKSIGIVDEIRQDEPPRSMLSPRGVTGDKDFDLDSMLNNEEATRPGSEPHGALPLSPASSSVASRPSVPRQAPSHAPSTLRPPSPSTRDPIAAQATPPPVWTRSTSPFPLATPKPVQTAAAPPGVVRSTARRSGLPGVAPAQGRPLPRATLRVGAVPPPFSPTARVPPPPPAPPLPISGAVASRGIGFSHAGKDEIEEVTPLPGMRGGFPSGPTKTAGQEMEVPRHSAPAPYPSVADASDPTAPHAAVASEAPLVLSQPQTIDFSDSVRSLLPDKRGGPSAWLTVLCLLVALGAGAALARTITRGPLTALLADVDQQPRGIAEASASPSGQATASSPPGSAAPPAAEPSPSEKDVGPRGSAAGQASSAASGKPNDSAHQGVPAATGISNAERPRAGAVGAEVSAGKRHAPKHAKKVHAKHAKKRRSSL